MVDKGTPYLSDNARRLTVVLTYSALISAQCAEQAARAPGVFTLSVPTGGGKTLASLRFAIRHARANGLKRIVYVIPYLSIIDQTARDFRKIFGDRANDWLLEHHSNVFSNFIDIDMFICDVVYVNNN